MAVPKASVDMNLDNVVWEDSAEPRRSYVSEPSSRTSVDPSDEARYQRFCRLAKAVVPNESVWEDIFLMRTSPFTPAELPFKQRSFLWSFESIALPFLKSAFSLGSSVVLMMLFMVEDSSDNGTSDLHAIALSFGSILLGTLVLLSMFEYPCRLLLYYRLWEHKVVVDFENRDLRHRPTQVKLSLLFLFFIIYCIDGFLIRASLAFYLIVGQTGGVVAQIVYSGMDFESSLIGFNRAMEHFGGPATQDAQELFGDVTKSISFVPEVNLMYDVIKINMYSTSEYWKTMNKEQQQEHLIWLRSVSLWMGQLGNMRDNTPSDAYVRATYATNFLNGKIYDDNFWQDHGSFANQVSKTGNAAIYYRFMMLVTASVYGTLFATFIKVYAFTNFVPSYDLNFFSAHLFLSFLLVALTLALRYTLKLVP